jgi:hypothetical protein
MVKCNQKQPDFVALLLFQRQNKFSFEANGGECLYVLQFIRITKREMTHAL